MATHAVFVNEAMMDFIELHNRGIRPATHELGMMFLYGDEVNDLPNEFINRGRFETEYHWCGCPNDNCNIVHRNDAEEPIDSNRMSYEWLLDMLNGFFPDHQTEVDHEGQIVVYTGLRHSKEDYDVLEVFDAP